MNEIAKTVLIGAVGGLVSKIWDLTAGKFESWMIWPMVYVGIVCGGVYGLGRMLWHLYFSIENLKKDNKEMGERLKQLDESYIPAFAKEVTGLRNMVSTLQSESPVRKEAIEKVVKTILQSGAVKPLSDYKHLIKEPMGLMEASKPIPPK
jgi:hypothetical protein